MKTYELTYIVTDALNDDEASHAMAEVAKTIEGLGGSIMKEEPWGKRRLVYPINHRSFGSYVTIQMHLEGEKVKELERNLRLNNQVLRHLLISLIPQAVSTTDEAELVEALAKRVEEKISADAAPEKAAEVEKVEAESPKEEEAPEPEVEAKPKKTAKVKKTNAEEKKEVNDEERKKLVEEKLTELLGEDKES